MLPDGAIVIIIIRVFIILYFWLIIKSREPRTTTIGTKKITNDKTNRHNVITIYLTERCKVMGQKNKMYSSSLLLGFHFTRNLQPFPEDVIIMVYVYTYTRSTQTLLITIIYRLHVPGVWRGVLRRTVCVTPE